MRRSALSKTMLLVCIRFCSFAFSALCSLLPLLLFVDCLTFRSTTQLLDRLARKILAEKERAEVQLKVRRSSSGGKSKSPRRASLSYNFGAGDTFLTTRSPGARVCEQCSRGQVVARVRQADGQPVVRFHSRSF